MFPRLARHPGFGPRRIVPPAVNPPGVEGELDRLYGALGQVTPESNPRTAKLLESSRRKVAQKVIEEAGEVALEAHKHDTRGLVGESADLLYHLVVLWRRAGVDPAEVCAEMRRRAEAFGIAEKLPKPRHRNSLPLRLKILDQLQCKNCSP